MEPDPNLWSEALPPTVLEQRSLDGNATVDRRTNVPESDKEAVSGVIHFFPAVSREERAQGLVVPTDKIGPRLVPDGVDQLSRPHDIREHECAALRALLLRRSGTHCRLRLRRLGHVQDSPESLEGRAGCREF